MLPQWIGTAVVCGSALIVGCGTPTSPAFPPQSAATSNGLSTKVTIGGTVVDDLGIPLTGATVSLTPYGVPSTSAVTDASGRYAVTLPATYDFGGRADKSGYETTWRDSYFEAGPGTLNFRLFRTIRVQDTDSTHLTLSADGSICGDDDEWFCRAVHVSVTHTGTLSVQASADDPTAQVLIGIGQVSHLYCCPTPTSSTVVAVGDDVLVYVQLPFNRPVTGVTLRTMVH